MTTIEQELIDVFRKMFPCLKDEEEIMSASMKCVREWDSISHISLMLALDETFGLRGLSADDFVNLTSFDTILRALVALKANVDR